MWDSPRLLAASAAATFMMAHASAAVLCVDLNSPNPQPPYADWATAAANIQDAVDAANEGDLVLVTNGLYQTGGRVIYGALTNRVAVNKPLTVQSVNGPTVTTICGNNQVNFPSVDVRCVYLTNGAVLSGFTLTNGGTLIYSSPQEDDGAGVWCESTTALISNCVIKGCSAFVNGGGAYSGSLANCTLMGNSSANGGGATSAYLTNCVLSGNFARVAGGGAQNCTISGCVLSNNFAALGGGASGGELTDCTIIGNGTTNTSYPQGLGGGVYQATLNNCSVICNTGGVGGGAYLSMLLDSMVSNNVAGDSGGGSYGGSLSFCTIVGNVATNSGGPAEGGGAYQATLNSCVLLANAASQGGGAAYGALTNCTMISNSASLYGGGTYGAVMQSCMLTNNSAWGGGGVSGSILVNCTLAGNSAGWTGGGALGCIGSGCDSTICTLYNCILTGNSAVGYHETASGGGATGATLNNCIITDNAAGEVGGGVVGGTLNYCLVARNSAWEGGGTAGTIVNNSTLESNRVYHAGGGAIGSTLNSCTLSGNYASDWGGGAADAALNNCTLAYNSAYVGGGAAGAALNNCVLYFNTTPDEDDGPNYSAHFYPNGNVICTLNYCCTFPLPTNGICNITNDPAFVNPLIGDFHLQTNSPCINSGLNSYAPGTIDLDGNPRIAGGTVDIGAYEFQSPSSLVGYAWLQQFNLPTDGSADFTDPDGDHMNNWQEWRAGTDPTNPSSLLRMLSPATATNQSGLILSWQSVPNRTYFLQLSTNLTLPSSFTTIQSNISGLPNITSYSDSNAVNGSGSFYRVGVQ